MRNFDVCFEHLIGLEGGYNNDPVDPGGETKYGISKRAYPDENIASLTIDQAKAIYKRDYWDAVKGDELPHGLDMLAFDAAVNQGVRPAITMLQKALNVAQDGILGLDTLGKARSAGKDVCALYLAERALRYYGTRNFDKYGRGWLKRLFIIGMEV